MAAPMPGRPNALPMAPPAAAPPSAPMPAPCSRVLIGPPAQPAVMMIISPRALMLRDDILLILSSSGFEAFQEDASEQRRCHCLGALKRLKSQCSSALVMKTVT